MKYIGNWICQNHDKVEEDEEERKFHIGSSYLNRRNVFILDTDYQQFCFLFHSTIPECLGQPYGGGNI
jgi:hypothetical protein